MIVMNNNLDKMIRAAGLQKKVVAERKGVTPETLSRHIHEKVPMTLRDAEDYAEILGCTPHQISYKSDPVKIVGKIHLTNDADKNIASINTFEESPETNKLGYAYLSSFHQSGTGAVTWTTEPDFVGPFSNFHQALETIRLAPIEGNYVDKECYQNSSWVKLKEPQIIGGVMKTFTQGVLFPEPGGLYTLAKQVFYDGNSIYRGLELEWATPVLAVILRPDLRDVAFVDSIADF